MCCSQRDQPGRSRIHSPNFPNHILRGGSDTSYFTQWEGQSPDDTGAEGGESGGDALQRQREMREWQQDWQKMGRWLLSSPTGSEEHPTSEEPGSTEEAAPVQRQARQEDFDFVNRATVSVAPKGLEKRRSMRNRMQRSVSDGYVLALKTVAAVRRVGRD